MVVYTQDKYIGENKTVGIQYKDVTAPIEPHQHTFIEIAYISEGEGTEWVNDRCYEVKRGDVIFLNYGDTHTFAPRGSFSHYEIFFAPKLVEEGVISPTNALTLFSLSAFGELLGEDGFEKLSFRGEERREIEFILSAMLREYTEEKEEADTVLTHYLNVLLTKFRRASHAVTADDAIEDIWERLRGYIDEHPEENLTLSSLASKSFYNPSYFSRMFKQRFGTAPMEYVRRRRIEKAMRLLIEEDAPIEDIASRVGFSDKSTFYHAFSVIAGMTPTEYRSKQGKK